ncbi:S66 peptidase family protein [Bacillus sp. 179-C3.3 HS]|uniref:S66 peptidase family protein n=1 Tax=Bacillus sp. 179-C3.3 HS TaxID=3232162 RepID=UPI00399FA107
MNQRPAALRVGDTVGIIAPASPPDEMKLAKGIEFLESLGLHVKKGQYIDRRYGYLAGRDHERVEEIHRMFRDREVKAIICACGGYGTARLAEAIDYDLIRQNPKIFWGYSDITFLHMAIHQTTGLVTFHGPMLSSDVGHKEVHPLTKDTFLQLFSPTTFTYGHHLSPLHTYYPGTVSAEITGGNLALIVTTLGTPFEIDTKGKLLFIEDIDEEPYKIDRMMQHLKSAGKLDDAAGFIIGDFHQCEPKTEAPSLTLEELWETYIVPQKKPALGGFRIGHSSPNFAIPIGATSVLDATKKTLCVSPGVSQKEAIK